MPAKIFERTGERCCWVLKTTRGGPGQQGRGDWWQEFRRDGVVAVGWARVGANPADYDYDSYLELVRTRLASEDRSFGHVASTIWSFANTWREGDIAIISEGYTADQQVGVLVHGIATAGEYFYDPNPQWEWRFKRKAMIVSMERDVPKQTFVAAFGLETMRQTMHGPFTMAQFEAFQLTIERKRPIL